MNILFIAHRRPVVPGKGDQVRAYQQIKGLIGKGHSVYCLFPEKKSILLYEGEALLEKQDETIYKKTTPSPYVSVLKSFLIKKHPLSVSLHSFPEVTQMVQYILSEISFDLVHIQSKMVHNFPDVDRWKTPVVVDYIDAISLNLERRSQSTKNWLEKAAVRGEMGRMRNYETFLQNNQLKGIITSPADRAHLNPEHLNTVDVVPNYIDLSYFSMKKSMVKKQAIVFTGTMSYAPNVDAAVRLAKTIFPSLKKQFPNLECWIVGANPSAEVKKLSSIEGVTVTGFVEDIRDWQWQAAVYVCPLRFGAGQQNKILEAAALGCPIVMSGITNAGIGFKEGEEAELAETNEEFIQKAAHILQAPSYGRSLAVRARAAVTAHYSEEKVTNKLLNAYLDAGAAQTFYEEERA